MKLSIAALLLVACTTSEKLPAGDAELELCNTQGYAQAMATSPPTWAGRAITLSDRCEVPCVQPPGLGSTDDAYPACDAYDERYGDVHCAASYKRSDGTMTGTMMGCCVTGATSGPVDFAVCN